MIKLLKSDVLRIPRKLNKNIEYDRVLAISGQS